MVPEFLNRVDETVLFKPLTLGEIERIVDLQMEGLRRRLADRRITLDAYPPVRKAAESEPGVVQLGDADAPVREVAGSEPGVVQGDRAITLKEGEPGVPAAPEGVV
ncbi:MAG: hypothetical protein ACR2H2_13390 [Solirubrobacteraceae bacterium]